MTHLADDPELKKELARLAPYMGHALEQAAAFALRYHAEELTAEHLFASMLEDEECAATRIVLHAFADPESIQVESVALAPGIMVVSSDRCIPFSQRGVKVLEGARDLAAQHSHANVEPAHLLQVALTELDAEHHTALEEAGWSGADLLEGIAASADGVAADGPVLRSFSQDTRRALSAGGRVADRLKRPCVSPAHLLIGCLELSPALAERTGCTSSRANMILAGRDADDSAGPGRHLAPDEELLEHLGALPDGGGSGEFLARLVDGSSDEMRALLARQKITPALLEHAGGAFQDPEPGS